MLVVNKRIRKKKWTELVKKLVKSYAKQGHIVDIKTDDKGNITNWDELPSDTKDWINNG